jgi:hypothetical protein
MGHLEFVVNTEVTSELRQEIIVELRKVRAPAKVAARLGIDIRLVLPIKDELADTPRIIREELHGGYGRPELQDFLVGRKKAWEGWDNSDAQIAKARSDYEAGTHDMMTGRDGDWLLLYSVPQQRITPRPDYFRPEV